MLHYDTQQTRSTREDTSRDPSHGLADILIHLGNQTLTLQLPTTGDSYSDNCMICLDRERSTSSFKTGQVSVLRHRALEWSDPSQWAEHNPGRAELTQQLFTVTQHWATSAVVLLLLSTTAPQPSPGKLHCAVVELLVTMHRRNEQLAHSSRAAINSRSGCGGRWSGDGVHGNNWTCVKCVIWPILSRLCHYL